MSRASGAAAEEEEEQRPPSPSLVKGSADDEKEDTAAEANAKVYVMDGGWKDICKGTLLVRVDKEPGANGVKGARLVMRNDTGKVKLNARLYPGLKARALRSAGPICVGVAPDGDHIRPAQIKLEEKVLTMSLVNCIFEEKLPPQPGAPHPAAEPPAAAPPTLKLTCAPALPTAALSAAGFSHSRSPQDAARRQLGRCEENSCRHHVRAATLVRAAYCSDDLLESSSVRPRDKQTTRPSSTDQQKKSHSSDSPILVTSETERNKT